MAEYEQLSILDNLKYPDDVVVAALRTFELDVANGASSRTKIKEYRGIMSDIVDLINLCDMLMDRYKDAEENYDRYVVSGPQRYREYKLKKEALVKLLPILKYRFADSYNKDKFLAEIAEITKEAFPPAQYRRASASVVMGELQREINEIYDRREPEQVFERNKKDCFSDHNDFSEKVNKRDIDPCSRLMKSLEWFSNGGEIKFGHEYVDNGYVRYSDSFDLDDRNKSPRFYGKFKDALAAMTEGKFKTEAQLYQRQENCNHYADIPFSGADYDHEFDYIMGSVSDMLGNENFRETYPFKNILIMTRAYVRAYEKEMYERTHDRISESIRYCTDPDETKKSLKLKLAAYEKQNEHDKLVEKKEKEYLRIFMREHPEQFSDSGKGER